MALAEFHQRRGLGGSAEHLYLRALAVVEQARTGIPAGGPS
jgi:hypothetical protein